MKNSLILILILCFQITYSQKVDLTGIAKTSENRGHVMIVLNDTLRKLPEYFPDSLYQKMWKNKNLICFSDGNGSFTINADLNDSLVFSRDRYISQTHKVSKLISQQDSINVILEPTPCVEYIPCNETNPELYIFIGEKLDVSPASQPNYCNTVSIDSKSQSKYKILEKFTNNLNAENINFVSYDHFSKVKYDEFQNVLLFVGKYCDSLIHQKYQYHPVYKMKNGKWASPIFEEYDLTERKSDKQPHKVEMAEPITIPGYNSYRKLEDIYKEPYFRIEKGKVYMLYGYYPEDLITD
ncbi:hypothetical protein [Lacinutrix sp. Hel_I_90]|uniref:hypothetical protein n=1 Tax=Lacinutrix sp. Hel_I_90 TaxID=1249999 RepID=UPI000B2FA811|nr:hypothetical protein [Lacinutrix sp. Hel_I_90]